MRRVGRLVLWIVLGGALCIGAVLAGGVGAVTYRPTWYRPAAIDYARLPADKTDLVNLVDRVSKALNAGEPVEITFEQDQVNRWLAAREELEGWPDALRLRNVDTPVVMFAEGNKLTAGVMIKRGEWGVVVSSTCAPRVAGDRIAVDYSGLKVGALPAPKSLLLEPLGQLVGESRARKLLDDGVFETGNDFTWQNGKVRFRVSEVALTSGVARVVFEPLNPRRGADRADAIPAAHADSQSGG